MPWGTTAIVLPNTSTATGVGHPRALPGAVSPRGHGGCTHTGNPTYHNHTRARFREACCNHESMLWSWCHGRVLEIRTTLTETHPPVAGGSVGMWWWLSNQAAFRGNPCDMKFSWLVLRCARSDMKQGACPLASTQSTQQEKGGGEMTGPLAAHALAAPDYKTCGLSLIFVPFFAPNTQQPSSRPQLLPAVPRLRTTSRRT
jgi:hypothetical protein